ncbi:MAG: hypothetical protein II822_10530 [Prevotella sp.]|nr:hypothetical protein [Prevotella sp.]
MKITAALELEKLREDKATWNKIFLHKDGKFYHAYQWSAWLIKMFVCTEAFQKERGDNKPIQANRYQTKTGDYVMLGFPLDSIGKYIPQYEDARKMEEGDDMEITVGVDFGEATSEALKAQFDEWAAACPLKDKQGVKSVREVTHQDGTTAQMGRMGVFGILQQVMSYPVATKTPTDNIEFITNLQQQVVQLL